MEEAATRIDKLKSELKTAKEELSAKDKEYVQKLGIINASDIEKPWKYEKWHASMTRLSRTNRQRVGRQNRQV